MRSKRVTLSDDLSIIAGYNRHLYLYSEVAGMELEIAPEEVPALFAYLEQYLAEQSAPQDTA